MADRLSEAWKANISAGRKLGYSEGRIRSNRKIQEIPEIHVPDWWGWWFAGFVDGEGCFTVNKNSGTSGRVQPLFLLSLRKDDEDVLRDIQRRLGIGTLRPSHRGRAITYGVRAAAHCMALITFFTRYQLQAKKACDFELWTPIIQRCYNEEKVMYNDVRVEVDALLTGRKLVTIETA